MTLKIKTALTAGCLLVAAAALVAGSSAIRPSHAHEDHAHVTFSAGEPGDPKKSARTITVKMRTEGKKMLFAPARIEVRRNEQIRFVLENEDDESHEFMLATVPENKKHAEQMKKYPDMEHDDPNGKRVSAYSSGEILWRFSKRGEFEYACLIPGHYEAGMIGKVIVK
jgi:uncharacterized cupredoxin-like copper-binding protein